MSFKYVRSTFFFNNIKTTLIKMICLLIVLRKKMEEVNVIKTYASRMPRDRYQYVSCIKFPTN
jgi:hypothetical protein